MFFRKDTKNKFELQIETLQQEATALQQLLTAEQAQLLIKTGLADQLQEDVAELEAELQTARHALDVLQSGGQGELAELAAAKADLQGQVATLSTRLDASRTLVAALEAEKSELKFEVEAMQVEIDKLQADLTDERTKHAQALAQVEQQRSLLDQSDNQRGSQIKQLQAAQTYLQDRLATTEKEVLKAKTDLAKARHNADAALNQARAEAATASESAAKELAALRKQLQAKSAAVGGLAAGPEAQSKQAQQLQAQYEDSVQENELLLLQLMQAQEELVEYYEEKTRFEQLYEASKARWERLEARLPNYVDYGALELITFDNLSETPSVTWRVKDFAQGGAVVPEFVFQTVLQDGQPGIGLFLDTAGEVHEGIPLVPKLIASNAAQVEKFVALSSTDFRKVSAAAIILAQQEATQWQSIAIPAQLDLSFWRPSLKLLAAQLQSLPPVLRYDSVKLKRELINPDYEHLWLELHGAVFGARSWKKLEARLGAAMVQAEGFSQFPKYEIPLIDGKHKPFDSWYAESYDDAGAKLELRFALDKNLLDGAVLAKLEEMDRTLVLRLVYAFPEMLRRLEAQHAAIHRPWATWIGFANRAVQVLELQRQEQAKARAAQKQSEQTQSSDAGEPPVDQQAETSRADDLSQAEPRSVPRKAPRVISIGNKPVVRTPIKARPVNMPEPVKAATLAEPRKIAKSTKAIKPAKVATTSSKTAIVNP